MTKYQIAAGARNFFSFHNRALVMHLEIFTQMIYNTPIDWLRKKKEEIHSSFSIICHFLPNPGRFLPVLTFNGRNPLDIFPINSVFGVHGNRGKSGWEASSYGKIQLLYSYKVMQRKMCLESSISIRVFP